MMILYHYPHCPFCIRVRLTLGFLKLPFESRVLAYNDESTPLSLTGKKMLPIMDFQNGKIQNESLDIISELFQRFTSANSISAKEFQSIEHLKSMSESVDLFMKSSSRKSEMEQLLSRIGEPVHSLCMPYWIWTPEFDKASRDYFTEKKEIKRGPMKNLVHRQSEFINTLAPILQHIEQETSLGFYRSSLFQIEDILLASHLWGLYIVPEFQFSKALHNYLQTIKSLCHFQYHEDFWK